MHLQFWTVPLPNYGKLYGKHGKPRLHGKPGKLCGKPENLYGYSRLSVYSMFSVWVREVFHVFHILRMGMRGFPCFSMLSIWVLWWATLLTRRQELEGKFRHLLAVCLAKARNDV